MSVPRWVAGSDVPGHLVDGLCALRPVVRSLSAALVLGCVALAGIDRAALAEEMPEYRLKAAFIYNFLIYTEWPSGGGSSLSLCILGKDPFGAEIDGLQGKVAGGRSIVVRRNEPVDAIRQCQAVYIGPSAMESLPRLLESLRGQPVLTLADSPGAMHRGVALNMALAQGRVSFEANLQAARAAGLNLSSKLMRLATEVRQ